MIHAQNIKFARVLDPVSGTGAVTMDDDIDTNGYNHATIVVHVGAIAAAMTALKVQESDDDSTYTDISGATADGGTETDGTTAALPDTADTIHVFNINLVGRKRYLRVVCIRGGTTVMSICGLLTRGEEASNVPATNGAATAITV